MLTKQRRLFGQFRSKISNVSWNRFGEHNRLKGKRSVRSNWSVFRRVFWKLSDPIKDLPNFGSPVRPNLLKAQFYLVIWISVRPTYQGDFPCDIPNVLLSWQNKIKPPEKGPHDIGNWGFHAWRFSSNYRLFPEKINIFTPQNLTSGTHQPIRASEPADQALLSNASRKTPITISNTGFFILKKN